MLNTMIAVITGIILVFFISTFRFDIKEGKDERGHFIITRAGMVTLIVFFFSFSIIFLVKQFHSFTGSEYEIILISVFDLALLTYSIMIMVLRRIY